MGDNSNKDMESISHSTHRDGAGSKTEDFLSPNTPAKSLKREINAKFDNDDSQEIKVIMK